MKLYFITEARFLKKGDAYYTQGSFTSALWNRYLSVFDEIVVVARVQHIAEDAIVDEKFRSDTLGVSFMPIPYYIGPVGFVKKRRKIISLMREMFSHESAYILRVPGLVGQIASKVLTEKGIKYGVEVVGDPYDVFAPNGNPIKSIIRKYNVRILKDIVKNASASIYVTKDQLQKRYPSAPGTFTTYASNVILKKELIEPLPRITRISTPKIVTLGMLSQMYKAPDVVIDALALLKHKGIPCTVTWVGDGKYKMEMIEYAKQKNVSDRINFIGLVPAGEAVRKKLYEHNLFILVSRTEGLPRALIEAMASGTYCIATRVGGIPELLNDEWLIDANSPEQLAEAIEKSIDNTALVTKQIEQNLITVRDYTEDKLKLRRENFYNELKRISV